MRLIWWYIITWKFLLFWNETDLFQIRTPQISFTIILNLIIQKKLWKLINKCTCSCFRFLFSQGNNYLCQFKLMTVIYIQCDASYLNIGIIHIRKHLLFKWHNSTQWYICTLGCNAAMRLVSFWVQFLRRILSNRCVY